MIDQIGTYKIVNKINNKIYYGSSKHIKKRFKQHKSQLKNNKHHCLYLQRAYNKYGANNFEYIIDFPCDNIEDALKIEQEYIDENFKELYNTSKNVSGGDNISYHPQKDKIIQKMKISLKRKFSSMSQEERKNIYGHPGEKNPMYGHRHTKESRKKMSEKNKGRSSLYARIVIINGKEFRSISEAAKHLDVSNSVISRRIATKKYYYKYPEKIKNICPKLRKRFSEIAKNRTGKKNGFFGKHHSEKSKELIRQYRKEHIPSNARKVIIENKEYISIREASRQLKVHPSTIIYRIKKEKPGYAYKDNL